MAWRYEPDVPNFPLFNFQQPPTQNIPKVSASEAKSMKKTVKLLQELGVIPKEKKEEKKDDKPKEKTFNLIQILGLLNITAPVVIVLQFLAIKFCINQLLELANSLPHGPH